MVGWLVFGLALAVRLVYLLQIDASPLFTHPPVDGATYVDHAQRLAAGNWLGHGEGAFWQPPLYPYLLAFFYVIVPDHFFYSVRLFQVLCGALGCVLIWLLGSRLFGAAVGAGAAIAASLYGPLVFFDGEILPATVGTVLNMTGLVLLHRALDRPSTWRLAGSGMVFGLAALTVATVLGFVIAAAAYVWYELRGQSRTMPAQLLPPVAFLLGAAVVIAPVTWRNTAVGGDFVLISANAGINFYVGNNPDYDGTVGIRPGWEWYGLLGRAAIDGGAEGLTQQSRFYGDRALDYIASEPLGYFGLLVRKTFLFWHGDEIGRNQDLYFWRDYASVLRATLWKWGIAFPFGLVGPLALVGLAVALRRGGLSLPVLFVAVYALSVIAFFVTARYRLAVVPLLLVYAAYAVECLVVALRQRRLSTVAAIAATLILGGAGANWALAPMRPQGAAAVHYNLGTAHVKEGDLVAAEVAFERAVQLDSAYWQAWYNLAAVQAAAGRDAAAVPTFQRVLRVHPGRVMVWISLARSHRRLGQADQALRAYETALRRSPVAFSHFGSYAELIDLYLEEGLPSRAEHVLDVASRYHPDQVGRLRSSLRGAHRTDQP